MKLKLKMNLMLLASLVAVLAMPCLAQAATHSEKLKAAIAAQENCQNVLRFDDAFLYLGFGAYMRGVEAPRSPIPSVLSVISLENPLEKTVLQTLDGVVDVIRIDSTLFALTYSGIEEYDLAKMARVAKYPTTNVTSPQMYREHATGMVLHNNKFFISQGALGLAVFDIDTRKVEKEILFNRDRMPLESQAIGIAKHGNNAVIAMDNLSVVEPGEKPAFRGFIVVDMNTLEIVAESEGLDPGPEAVNIVGDRVFVSFGHVVWDYDISRLMKPALGRDHTPTFRFAEPGHPTGRPSYDDTYLYTCYSHHNLEHGGLSKRKPRVLNKSIINQK